MRNLLALLTLLVLSTTLAACAYDPPMRADHAAPQYRADLATCQKDGTTAADKRTHAYGYLFLSYPVSYPFVRHQEIRKCMEGKGYAVNS